MSSVRVSLALCALAACGGANLNQRAAGNHDGGIAISHDEIAIDPRGEHIVVRAGTDLYAGDLATRTLARIANIDGAKLLAFHDAGFFAYTAAGELVSYDLGRGKQLWRRAPGGRWDRLDVTPDGAHVVLSGADVQIFDAVTGESAGGFTPERSIEDVDITPDSARIVVTEHEHWQDFQPWTDVHVVDAASGAKLCTATVPNCADELIIHPDGTHAYLAPTSCKRDPVSIVDITASCRFEKNLPGFGPVALTPDGATGVAFLERQDGGFDLMTFDTRSHELHTIPIGMHLPRYLLTPDGKTLVVDGVEEVVGDGKQIALRSQRVRLVDLATRTVREAEGPRVMLNAFVVTPDSRQIWLIHSDDYLLDKREVRAVDIGLFAVDVPGARIERIPLAIAPEGINALPGVATLLLRDGSQIHLFDVASRRITGTVRAP
jgi:hypothetical protein